MTKQKDNTGQTLKWNNTFRRCSINSCKAYDFLIVSSVYSCNTSRNKGLYVLCKHSTNGVEIHLMFYCQF